MRKFNKKTLTVIGTVVLGLSIIAFPALADTTTEKESWFNQMNQFMSGEKSPEAIEEFINSDEFLDMHENPETMNEVYNYMHGEDGIVDEEWFDEMHGDSGSMNEVHDYMHGGSGSINNMHGNRYSNDDNTNNRTGMMGF